AERLPLRVPTPDDLGEVAGRVGGGAYFCDISDRESVATAFAAASADRGPLHAFVANSGIGGANADGPDDRFEEIVRTNLFGTYWCIRARGRPPPPPPAARGGGAVGGE